MMERSLNDWLIHLEGLHPKGQGGIELGLSRVNQVKEFLDQKIACPLVIVGGTNGKGSTCAYLEAIYSAAGYRVGCYTSPHLIDYNERVRVAKNPVDDLALCRAFTKVEQARVEAGNVNLTYFEFGTLAAMEVFIEQKLDVIILEVGLGGRLDAVNIYDPDCAIVTSIALDHIDWLGDTRELIGFEKAGIYRAGKCAVCADPEPPESLINYALKIKADLKLFGRDFSYQKKEGQYPSWQYDANVQFSEQPSGQALTDLPIPSLVGDCQLRNAAAAITVIQSLQARLPVALGAFQSGLVQTALPGRFQIVSGSPLTMLDVAHNPEAAKNLARSLLALDKNGKTIAVVGMLADKDIKGSLQELSGCIDLWLCATLPVARGAEAEQLKASIQSINREAKIFCFASVEEAFKQAKQLASDNDKILVTGSFHTVAEIMQMIKP